MINRLIELSLRNRFIIVALRRRMGRFHRAVRDRSDRRVMVIYLEEAVARKRQQLGGALTRGAWHMTIDWDGPAGRRSVNFEGAVQ